MENNIKIRVLSKTYDGKSNATSGNRYIVKADFNGNIIDYVFDDGSANDAPDEWMVWCYLTDAIAYYEHTDLLEFMEANNLYNLLEAKQIHDGCKKAYERLTETMTIHDICRTVKAIEAGNFVCYDKRKLVMTNTCSICGKSFEGWGNNPDPIYNPEMADMIQRCCDSCVTKWVIPARMHCINTRKYTAEYNNQILNSAREEREIAMSTIH